MLDELAVVKMAEPRRCPSRLRGTLAINKDIPLTREGWIELNWLGDPPQPWRVEHEMEVTRALARPL
jgi:hypothetical protein